MSFNLDPALQDLAGQALAQPSDLAVEMLNAGKRYELYDRPWDRLRQFFLGKSRPLYKELWALQGVSLALPKGQVLGVVGRNGAGKSTLLQLLCGTLLPSQGSVTTQGRIAALLELGAGFNPEFTGRDNIFLNAAILGLTHQEVLERFDDIVSFSGIEPFFIEQPVKTYSSGMYVRLAFAVATSVDPDILVVDEALSVGDGEFARKSFDRIMQFKDQGKTILFCSHSLYQVEAICSQAIWLDHGRVQMQASPKEVVAAYNDFLARESRRVLAASPLPSTTETAEATQTSSPQIPDLAVEAAGGLPRILNASIQAGEGGVIRSERDALRVTVSLQTSKDYPMPSLGVVVLDDGQRNVCSAGSHIDAFEVSQSAGSVVQLELCWPAMALLKGRYHIDLFLLCEKGIHVYEHIRQVASFEVTQTHLEVGVVRLAHQWSEPKA
jgi:lipopolysaccharide transport system ATP-binding protein